MFFESLPRDGGQMDSDDDISANSLESQSVESYLSIIRLSTSLVGSTIVKRTCHRQDSF